MSAHLLPSGALVASSACFARRPAKPAVSTGRSSRPCRYCKVRASSTPEEETSSTEYGKTLDSLSNLLGAAAEQAEDKAKVVISTSPVNEVSKFARGAATTFAPRPSGAVKNPAYKGSVLYTIFGVQAWLSLAVGALLSFNIIFPTDEPSIARLLGMWSVWMFTVPSLRARECTAAEKDALNILFLLIPVINVSLPFVWKSFPFIYSADVVAMAGIYLWKIGLPGKGNNASS